MAYVASIGVAPDASWISVFGLTSAVAILGYGLGHFHDSIWKGQNWITSLKFLFDGVLYGLVTATIFAWLR